MDGAVEMRFASFLSGGFITTITVINPPECKLAKRTSVRCGHLIVLFSIYGLGNC